MYTAQSTVSTVHTTVMSQLNPERDQSSGTITNTYVCTYLPYLHTGPTYLPLVTYILPLKTNKTPPFEISSKKDQEDQDQDQEGI